MLAAKAASGRAGIRRVGFNFSVIPNGKVAHAGIFKLALQLLFAESSVVSP